MDVLCAFLFTKAEFYVNISFYLCQIKSAISIFHFLKMGLWLLCIINFHVLSKHAHNWPYGYSITPWEMAQKLAFLINNPSHSHSYWNIHLFYSFIILYVSYILLTNSELTWSHFFLGLYEMDWTLSRRYVHITSNMNK